MTTLADLVSDVEATLYSYSADRDRVTTLTQTIDDNDVAFTVDSAMDLDSGFLEIDYELLAVKSKNETSGTVAIHPWGRAQRGTTAAAHTSGARVAINPRFPRSEIKRQINQTIDGLFPSLWQVKSDETNTSRSYQLTYPVPADTEHILAISWDSIGPSKAWVPIKSWRLNFSANTTEFPTGKTVEIGDGPWLGRKIRIVYTAAFTPLATDATTLPSVGLKNSWADLIKAHVVAKMLWAGEAHRAQASSVESTIRNGVAPPGTGAQVARQMLAYFTQQVEDERRLLLTQYPITTHWSR